MTIGEKIKMYRAIKMLSQKQLAERSGLSEISIRKYEAGVRNPKIEQIKKIADALGIYESQLTDVPISNNINTVGDVMSILYALRSHIGWDLHYALNGDSQIDENSIKIHFNHPKINEKLKAIAMSELSNKEMKQKYDSWKDEFKNDFEWEKIVNDAVLEEEQRKLTNDPTPLNEKQTKSPPE